MNSAQIHDTKLIRVSGAVAAGSADITNLAGIDTAGFDSAIFLVAMGAITAGAATSIKLQQSSDDGSVDAYSDIAGTSLTIPDTGDNKLWVLEVIRPTKQWIKLYIARATQTSVVEAAIAILGGAHDKPITQPASVGGSELHVSPLEGTA
jgi:hypothetical protein